MGLSVRWSSLSGWTTAPSAPTPRSIAVPRADPSWDPRGTRGARPVHRRVPRGWRRRGDRARAAQHDLGRDALGANTPVANDVVDWGMEFVESRGLELLAHLPPGVQGGCAAPAGLVGGSGRLRVARLAQRFPSTLPPTLALTAIGLVRARRGETDAWGPLDEALALAEPSGELQRIAPVAAARAEVAWPRAIREDRPGDRRGLRASAGAHRTPGRSESSLSGAGARGFSTTLRRARPTHMPRR